MARQKGMQIKRSRTSCWRVGVIYYNNRTKNKQNQNTKYLRLLTLDAIGNLLTSSILERVLPENSVKSDKPKFKSRQIEEIKRGT